MMQMLGEHVLRKKEKSADMRALDVQVRLLFKSLNRLKGLYGGSKLGHAG